MQRLITLWPVLFTSIVETVAVNVIVPQFVSRGLSNYKMEFRRAAIFAALSNRSLCLTTMMHGRTGDVPLKAVQIQELYDLEALARFVPLMTDHLQCQGGQKISCCVQTKCNKNMIDLMDDYRHARVLVTSGCLFPNFPVSLQLLLWRSLRKSRETLLRVAQAGTALFGPKSEYIAVHWRFEEFRCKRHKLPLGLCMRTFPSLLTNSSGFVVVTPVQVADAIIAAAKVRNYSVFLATDGRARRRGRLVDEVKALALTRGNVTIKELLDASADPRLEDLKKLSSVAIMELEQGICASAALHIGSSLSSWDWEVYYAIALRANNLHAFELAFHLENKILGLANEPNAQHWDRMYIAPPPDTPFMFLDHAAVLVKSDVILKSQP